MPETSREYKAAVKSFAARKAGSKQPADILVRDDLTGTYCFQVERRSRAVTQPSPSGQQKPTRALTPGESGPPEISGKPSWSRPFAAPSGVRIIFSWARKRDLQAIRQIRKPRLCCPYERLGADPLGCENYEFAKREGFIRRENRLFVKLASAPHGVRS